VATKYRLSAAWLIPAEDVPKIKHTGVKVCGRLCQIALKEQQKIRGYGDAEYARRQMADALAVLFAKLKQRAWSLDERLEELIVRVAAKVVQREVKKLERV
jgi:translation elongation factor EF-Tu-like GTPase